MTLLVPLAAAGQPPSGGVGMSDLPLVSGLVNFNGQFIVCQTPPCRAGTQFKAAKISQLPFAGPVNAAGNLNMLPTDLTLSILPVGNALTSLSAFNIQATSATPPTPTRQYMTNFNFIANHGVDGGNAGNGDLATIYASIEAQPNSGNVWVFNPLVQVDAGSPPTAHHQISELDMANNFQDVSSALGPAGVAFPGPSSTPGGGYYIYGEIAECSGTHNCTAAFEVAGANRWHRGFLVDQTNAVDQASFADYSTSPIVLDVWGVHTNVVDVANANATAVIHLAQGNAGIANVLARDNVFTLSSAGDLTKDSGINPGDPIVKLGLSNDGILELGSAAHGGTTPSIRLHNSGSAAPDVTIQNLSPGDLLVQPSNGPQTAAFHFNPNGLALPRFTASTIPTCNAGSAGAEAIVTDAASPTYGGTYTGGGSTWVPVICNGSNWTTH